MNILMTGASGFLGGALVPFLTRGGHRISRLVRSRPDAAQGRILWDPAAGKLNASELEGFEAIVHLSGETIAQRWTAKRKQRIYDSRIQSTRLLVETLTGLSRPPQVLVAASAIGYYGDRGDEVVREDSPPGSLWLSRLCRDWEAATRPASPQGLRVVNLRFGIILSPEGGALAPMLLPFRLGLGGRVGSGRQWMSWIALDDVLGVVQHALSAPTLAGPVNVVAPHPVTNREFTQTLGRVLGRPAVFPLPAGLARLVLGEMANELLLASARVAPARLQETQYAFRFTELEAALRVLLGKPGGQA